jgi:hypothetical protein
VWRLALVLTCALAVPAPAVVPTGDAVVDECVRLFGRCRLGGEPKTEVKSERSKKKSAKKKPKKKKKKKAKKKARRTAPKAVPSVSVPVPVVPEGGMVEPPVEANPEPNHRLPSELEGVPREPGPPLDEEVEGDAEAPSDG